MAEYKLILEHTTDPEYKTLAGYKAKGGYAGLEKAVGLEKSAIIDSVKTAGLRGRGGAGAPATRPPEQHVGNVQAGVPQRASLQQLPGLRQVGAAWQEHVCGCDDRWPCAEPAAR